MKRQFIHPNVNIGNSGYADYYLNQLNGNKTGNADSKSSKDDKTSSAKDKNGYSANFNYKSLYGGYNSKPLTEIAQNKAKKAHNAKGGNDAGGGNSDAINTVNDMFSTAISAILQDHKQNETDANNVGKEANQTKQETDAQINNTNGAIQQEGDNAQAQVQDGQNQVQQMGEDSRALVQENQELNTGIQANVDEATRLTDDSNRAAQLLDQKGVNAPTVAQVTPTEVPTGEGGEIQADAQPPDGSGSGVSPTGDSGGNVPVSNPVGTSGNSDVSDPKAKTLVDKINNNNQLIAGLENVKLDLLGQFMNNQGAIAGNNAAIATMIGTINDSIAAAKSNMSQTMTKTNTDVKKTISKETSKGTQEGVKSIKNKTTSGAAVVAAAGFEAAAAAAEGTGVGSAAAAELKEKARKAEDTAQHTGKASFINDQNAVKIAMDVTNFVTGLATGQNNLNDITAFLTQETTSLAKMGIESTISSADNNTKEEGGKSKTKEKPAAA